MHFYVFGIVICLNLFLFLTFYFLYGESRVSLVLRGLWSPAHRFTVRKSCLTSLYTVRQRPYSVALGQMFAQIY